MNRGNQSGPTQSEGKVSLKASTSALSQKRQCQKCSELCSHKEQMKKIIIQQSVSPFELCQPLSRRRLINLSCQVLRSQKSSGFVEMIKTITKHQRIQCSLGSFNPTSTQCGSTPSPFRGYSAAIARYCWRYSSNSSRVTSFRYPQLPS